MTRMRGDPGRHLPCVLGLTTPTALLAATGRGAQLGVLVSGPQARWRYAGEEGRGHFQLRHRAATSTRSPVPTKEQRNPSSTPEVTQFNFSAKPILRDDNQAGGLILKNFHGKNRIIDGLDDGFIVKTVS